MGGGGGWAGRCLEKLKNAFWRQDNQNEEYEKKIALSCVAWNEPNTPRGAADPRRDSGVVDARRDSVLRVNGNVGLSPWRMTRIWVK